MEKVLKIIVLLFSCMCLISTTAYADENSESGVYEFPVQKGTEEWAKLTTRAQQIAATQIPKEILVNMNTADLLETVLNYPLLIDVTLFNSFTEGVEAVARNFNGMTELLSRDDLPDVLLERYSAQTVPELGRIITTRSTEEVKNISSEYMKMTFLEIMLAQPVVLDSLEEDSARLQTVLAAKYEEKSEDGAYEMGLYTFDMAVAEIEDSELSRVIPPSWVRGDSVYTPNGREVITKKCIGDLSTAEKKASDQESKSSYPNATFLSTSTAYYNCHAYAWHEQNTGMRIWIDSAEAVKYVTDGSYTQITDWPGYLNKIYYEGGIHSGIICSAVGKVVQSKWGYGPLMQHMYYYGPYADAADGATYYMR